MTDIAETISGPPLEGGTTRSQLSDTGRSGKGAALARGYYDVPMLKPSLWKWEISSYFFFGGLAGGAFAIARMADRFGGYENRAIVRTGTAIALSAFLPCAPLLIADLGDPTRFHYMLRVFKPKSPMNLGAWVLTAFGGILSLAALNEWRVYRNGGRKGGISGIVDAAIRAVSDIAGVPLALGLAGYTGVLLSTTATPIWTRNGWLGPLFSASAVSTGASAISLAMAARSGRAQRRTRRPLQRISAAARVAEAVTLGGFMARAGGLAKPVTQGEYAPQLWGGAIGVGLVLSTLLESVPTRSDAVRRRLQIVGAAAALAGGFALRWAITQAGRPSGGDPNAARASSSRSPH